MGDPIEQKKIAIYNNDCYFLRRPCNQRKGSIFMKKSYYFYLFSIILILLHFTIAVSCASEKNIQENIVLTPADQLILNRIDK